MGACSFCSNDGNGKLTFGQTGADKPFDFSKLTEEKTEIKFLCVGDSKVGKSTFLQSYSQGQFVETTEEKSDLTIEKEFYEKKVQIVGEELPCGENEKKNRQDKYKDSSVHAIVVCVAVDQQEKEKPAENWISEIQEVQNETPIILILTKIDLV